MNKLFILSMLLVGLNAELIDATEIKKTIVIHTKNGITEVIGLDSPDKKIIEYSEDTDNAHTRVVVHLDQKPTQTFAKK